jgi:prepilin-type N-terminal cleavage/methylation domain-containing protein
MLGGKKLKPPLGYTIIEVMIVLAVSGVMFLIAATFINGKQERASFQTGVNEMASQIQDTINQVTDGQYSDIPLNCQGLTAGGVGAAANAGQQVTFPSIALLGNPEQGGNSGCVFAGKIFHFSLNNDPSSYEIFSMAASRQCLTSDGVLEPLTFYCDSAVTGGYSANYPLEGSGIVPIAQPFTNADNDLTSQATVPQDLSVVGMSVTDTSGSPSYEPISSHSAFTIGFVQGFGASQAGNGNYQSGAQTVNMIEDSIPTNLSESSAAGHVLPSNLVLAENACIGLSDGQQYAEIDLGSTGSNQLAPTVKFLGTTDTTPCS